MSRYDRFVYFIQRGGSDGPIKVGVSDNPQGRLRQLQGAHFETLALIGTTVGDHLSEKKMHRALKDYSLGREWYSPCEALFALIETPTPNLSHVIATTRLARDHLREALHYFEMHVVSEASVELQRVHELVQEALDHLVTDGVGS